MHKLGELRVLLGCVDWLVGHHSIELALHHFHVCLLLPGLDFDLAFGTLVGHGISSYHIVHHIGECILVHPTLHAISLTRTTSHQLIDHIFCK